VKQSVVTTLLVLGSLAAVGPAHAKELAGLKVCGSGGCKDVTEPALLRKAIGLAEIAGEPVQTATPPPAPFFRLEFIVKGDEAGAPSFLQHYVPSSGALTWRIGEGSWIWIDAGNRRALYDQAIAGVKPFGKPRFTGVLIDGKRVADPASYERLFRLGEATSDYPDDSDWVPIEFATRTPSPWSTDAPTIEYSPSENMLWRGGELINVPDSLASNLERRRSLNAATGDAFPWLLFGGLGGAAVVVPLALLLRRRRIR
jgi:hypothetical protein